VDRSSGIIRAILLVAGTIVLVLVVQKWPQADASTSRHQHTGLARNLLSREGYHWQTHEFEHGHVHFLPNSHAEKTKEQISQAIDSVRTAVLTIVGLPEREDERIDVFFVDSREQMQTLIGRPMGGMVQSGEPTAVLVYNAQFAPFLLHEITHLYTHYRWGAPLNGRWISEGIAMLVSGDCQGHSIHDFVKGLHEDNRLTPWPEFVRNFDRLDELSANPQAASMVAFLRSKGGMTLVRDVWTSDGWSVVEQRFGAPIGQIEREWWGQVQNTGTAARLDIDRLRREGCK
jgi:hypothetical protein